MRLKSSTLEESRVVSKPVVFCPLERQDRTVIKDMSSKAKLDFNTGSVTSLVAQMVEHLPTMRETQVQGSSGEGNGNPLWFSCLENPMKRGAWWATVRGVAQLVTT